MQVPDALEQIRHAFETGRPAHAYMIAGPPRGEAGALALKVVQMLFCSKAPYAACGVCHECLACAEHRQADALWVESAKKSRQISADQMRDVQRQMLQTSYVGGWKVCVLLGADRMNKASANAFLKTLEEPPGQTLFLLVTDSPQMLLPTIASRCQRIDVLGAGQTEFDEKWRNQAIEILVGHQSGVLAGMATGTHLCNLLKEMKAVAEKRVEEQLDEESDEPKDVLDARVAARYKEMRSDLLRFLEGWYRDMLLLVSGGEAHLLFNPSVADVLKRKASTVTLRKALSYLKMVENISRQLERNMQEPEVFGYWMGRLP